MHTNLLLELLSGADFWVGVLFGTVITVTAEALKWIAVRQRRRVAYNATPRNLDATTEEDAELQRQVDAAAARHFPALMQG